MHALNNACLLPLASFEETVPLDTRNGVLNFVLGFANFKLRNRFYLVTVTVTNLTDTR